MKLWPKTVLAAVIFGWLAGLSLSAAEFSAGQLEFFEQKIRPLLVENCYQCHSVTAKKLKGELYLDSRAGVLHGGDLGAVVVAGEPDKSTLIRAVEYTDNDLQMPPKKQLSSAQVADLKQWVKLGLPWPKEAAPKMAGKIQPFDLEKRREEHWAWQPIQSVKPPVVKDVAWARTPIDRFILAKLEQEGLKPAQPAEKRTLIRRLYFDIIGLPPTPQEVDAFVKDQSPKATEVLVDRLLAMPQFGERWARHWLDLVRYAETMGHEFDYPIHNAWRYRDYVIRAFNADVPYNQFAKENIAGDLLPHPRMNPQEGFNESIIGTASYWLLQQKHSPVDVRLEQAELINNQIDVLTKTFLGMTVSCARCHDHKFDAISAKDYYSLYGIMESSHYRQADIEGDDVDRLKAAELQGIRKQIKARLAQRFDASKLTAYAKTAEDIIQGRVTQAENATRDGASVFADFEGNTFAGWTVEGDAFGEGPVGQNEIGKYQGDVGAVGHGFVNSHNVRRGGRVIQGDKFTGKLTSPVFKITKRYIHFLVGGGAHKGQTCVNLLVDGKVVRTETGKNNNHMGPAKFEVGGLLGKEARIEIVDAVNTSWGNIGVDHIVFSDADSCFDENNQPLKQDEIIGLAQQRGLNLTILKNWVAVMKQNAGETSLGKGDVEYWTTGRDFPQGGKADGVAFDMAPPAWGDFVFDAGANQPVSRLVMPKAVDSAAGSRRLQGALRSAAFTIEKNYMHFLVAGEGTRFNIIIDSFNLIRNPIYGQLKQPVNNPVPQWVTVDVSMWKGHRACLELVDRTVQDLADQASYPADGWLALQRVVFSDAPTLAPKQETADWTQVAVKALPRWLANQTLSQNDLASVNRLVTQQLVDWGAASDASLATLSEKYRAIEQSVTAPVTVPAMMDVTPVDEHVFLRGSPKRLGDVVQRRNLEALNGNISAIYDEGSGRLQLAEDWTSEGNPLLARVMVNKIWHHLMGRGIVASVDNFGVLGQRPSHPELLDWLAKDFQHNGWSMKKLIREIVLTRTYQMSSHPADAQTEEHDPNNTWWHRMNVKRLEGEAIRDTVLAVSGSLDKKMFGPSVPIHLTEFMDGRGKPGVNGPLDGNDRRSLYVEVRRNFLSPMMLAYDAPIPFTTVGRRTVSNVPAQALIMMNDPFIVQQAKLWAERLLSQHDQSVEQRLANIYETAFARPMTKTEHEFALSFLKQQAAEYGLTGDNWQNDPRVWTDFCHVMFNVKEFVFVN